MKFPSAKFRLTVAILTGLSIFSFIFIQLPMRSALAIEAPEKVLPKTGITPQHGKKIDLTLKFRNSAGELKSLDQIFLKDRPNLIIPAYFRCPRLCGLVSEGVLEAINAVSLKLGADFRVLTVSFDPSDSSEGAAAKEKQYFARLKDSAAGKGNWQFLTGEAGSEAALMSQIGFNYIQDQGEFAHSAALIVVTPGGFISQYFTGIQYAPQDLRLALVEASQGRIGTAMDLVLLYCFRFDATQGKYTWAAFNLMRAGGMLTLVVLGVFLYRLWRSGGDTALPAGLPAGLARGKTSARGATEIS